jgi:hypothetical protein
MDGQSLKIEWLLVVQWLRGDCSHRFRQGLTYCAIVEIHFVTEWYMVARRLKPSIFQLPPGTETVAQFSTTLDPNGQAPHPANSNGDEKITAGLPANRDAPCISPDSFEISNHSRKDVV